MADPTKTLSISIEEGNVLVGIASVFHLPEKLGPDHTYSVADRAIAADEVRSLFRELRSYSPLMQGDERFLRFGPPDAWKEVRGEGGRLGHKLIKPLETVTIRLDENVFSGIIWCLLMGLHPASQMIQPIPNQEDSLWPLAKKLSRVKVIREMIGITVSTQPKRWKSDEEYGIPA